MSFDRASLETAVSDFGPVARVVVAAVAGSAPREVGSAMLVWAEGQSGTIGGGALEHTATQRARLALQDGDRVDKVPLGPGLGQCCGGAVTLVTEVWTADRLAPLEDAVLRPLPGITRPCPLKMTSRLRAARNGTRRLTTDLVQGWLIEPVLRPQHALWLWGAGHVGRALARTLAPLPQWQITWIDTAADRFPDIPDGVIPRLHPTPQALVPEAPDQAHHIILTYSHTLDLELCHRLLLHGFGSLGLIGSGTKRARFFSRLRNLGHSETTVQRITCPIGDPSLGKHPQAIALGVATHLIRDTALTPRQEVRSA